MKKVITATLSTILISTSSLYGQDIFDKISEKVDQVEKEIKSQFKDVDDLEEIRQIIAKNNYSSTEVARKIDLYSKTLATHSNELKSVQLKVTSSIADWKAKNGSITDFLKTYPYQLNVGSDVEFQNELGYLGLGIHGLKFDFSMRRGLSLKALDNLGINLLSASLDTQVKLNPLKVMKRALGNEQLQQACTKVAQEDMQEELEILKDASSSSNEALAFESLTKITKLVCSMSIDVVKADSFKPLVEKLDPKFKELEKELDLILKEYSQALGTGFAMLFSLKEDGWLSNTTSFFVKNFIKLLSSYKFKADSCSGFRVSLRKCVPKITIYLFAQPLFGETSVGIELTEKSAKLAWQGEAVPYALNFITDNIKKETYVTTYMVMKTFESLTDEEVILLAQKSANGFTELSKLFAELLAPEIEITNPKTDIQEELERF